MDPEATLKVGKGADSEEIPLSACRVMAEHYGTGERGLSTMADACQHFLDGELPRPAGPPPWKAKWIRRGVQP